jgi:hypothetical protein
LTCQLVRHRVIACVELDVIIDVHSRRFPRGELVVGGGQWLQRRTFELLEQVVAGNGLSTKASGIDQPEVLGDGGVHLSQRKNWRLRKGARIQRSATCTPTSAAAFTYAVNYRGYQRFATIPCNASIPSAEWA